jgi:hypothetical protein
MEYVYDPIIGVLQSEIVKLRNKHETLRQRIEALATKLAADPLRFSASDMATDLRSLLEEEYTA